MKLAFTIANCGEAVNCGGVVERDTYIADVPDELIPVAVLNLVRRQEEAETSPSSCIWETMSVSVVRN